MIKVKFGLQNFGMLTLNLFLKKEKLQNKAFHAERAGKNYLYIHDVNGIVL